MNTKLTERDELILQVGSASIFLEEEEEEEARTVVSLLDITERKNAEAALKKSEAQLINALEIAHLGHWEYDVANDLFTFNDQFYKIFHTTAEQVGGYILSSADYAKRFVYSDDIQVVGEEIRKAIETTDPGFNRQLEHRMLYSDGTMGYITVRFFILKDDKGNTIKTYGVNQDITGRKNMEVELIDSEIRYHDLFENSSEFLYTLDLKGSFTDVNKAAQALTGYPKSELLKTNFRDYTQKKDHRNLFCTLSNIYKTGKPVHDFPVEAIIKDKSIKYFETSLTLLKKGDQIIGFHGSSKDITERKRAEEELIRAKEKAEAGNRLKTAFMNNISHEVRTPLNGILGFSNLITQPDITDDEKVEYYSHIKTSSNRLLSTIDNYMDSSLIASGTMEVNRKPMDLHPMLYQLRDQFQPLCAIKDLEYHLEIPGKTERITLYSDAELLRKALSHLLDNAVKFTAKGEITVGYAIKPGVLEFFVKDTGSGISKEAQTRIFESFVQEELLHTRGYEGSGLGLSIAQGLVRLLGGELRVESEKGAGSTFFFTLPREETETVIIAKTEGKQKAGLVENQVILIAEDEESNLVYFQTILSKTAVTVLSANNGEEAVDVCRAHPEISLVLMDLKMPVMDGLEATRAIKTFRENLPIIAITAFAMSGDEKRALDAGCDDYLSKPVTREALLEKLKQFGVV